MNVTNYHALLKNTYPKKSGYKMNANFPILLVEDDEIPRTILVENLVKHGHIVEIALNGKDALKKMNKKFYPIVLTDWIMPEMNGIELCKTIRKKKWCSYVYIIILTIIDTQINIIKGLNGGADDYLCKPINHDELIARINTGIRILKLEKSLIKSKEKIKFLSITDPLTHCYNRNYLTEKLPQEIKRAKRYLHPLSILLLDIDFFKEVNDNYGHLIGDTLLKEFVIFVEKNIRTKIDWISRFGGEEFIIVLPETDNNAATIVAKKLCEKISKHKFKDIKITVSIGVSTYLPTDVHEEISTDLLINRADQFLYKAKKAGRNQIKS